MFEELGPKSILGMAFLDCDTSKKDFTWTLEVSRHMLYMGIYVYRMYTYAFAHIYMCIYTHLQIAS